MPMEEQEARVLLYEAGIKLVELGLVARTWGNISCRLNQNSFVITPSGRTYEELTPQEMVVVQIEDLSWSGTIKPSSELGLHAEVYKISDSIGVVIHTHQQNASAVAAARKNIPSLNDEIKQVLGGDVHCAAYGLPGTKKLKMATATALRKSGSKAALMANHGAVCYGTNMEEAFAVASTLEEACALYVEQEFNKRYKTSQSPKQKIYDFYKSERRIVHG